EAFGPVSTLMTYDTLDEALALAAMGKGSLVGTLVTKDPATAARFVPAAAAMHGRILVLDREAAQESTGHGSPLPQLKHGGPGRAGGGAGDSFYMHFDEIAAKESPFGKRIAHGYFVLSAAAGLFVEPKPGPVLANYGLDTLRFVKPVGIGDTIQARLTAKRKIDKKKDQGVVAWDVEVTNQYGELVASYDILTLVAKRPTA